MHILIEQRRIRTLRFAALFALSLAIFVGAIDALILWCNSAAFFTEGNAILVGTLLAFVLGAGLYQVVRLRGDGPKVASILGGTPVVLDPSNKTLNQFRNVATEVAIAAGVPMPLLFVMNSEDEINAFAAGTAGNRTAVCVSAGALDKLTRDELQGVLAHEMSHLKYNDAALTRLLAAGLFALLCFVGLGYGAILVGQSAAQSKSKEGGGLGFAFLLAGGAAVLVGLIGSLMAGLLEAAVSREMEFRADADAVRMVNCADGLIGALIKIGQERKTFASDDISDRFAAINPMFFNANIKQFWFDSHPPLLARIRALDPARAATLQLEQGL